MACHWHGLPLPGVAWHAMRCAQSGPDLPGQVGTGDWHDWQRRACAHYYLLVHAPAGTYRDRAIWHVPGTSTPPIIL